MKAKNVFVTGKPGSGKTTLITRLAEELGVDVGGFVTQEVRKSGERIGFDIVTLDGRKGILARKGLASEFKVGRYGVNIKDLEAIAVEAVRKTVRRNRLVILDEIGKMELFSEKFKEAVLEALDSEAKVLGTIKTGRDPFTDKLRARRDTEVIEVTSENRQQVFNSLKRMLG